MAEDPRRHLPTVPADWVYTKDQCGDIVAPTDADLEAYSYGVGGDIIPMPRELEAKPRRKRPGRLCAGECGTVLSIYNPRKVCNPCRRRQMDAMAPPLPPR